MPYADELVRVSVTYSAEPDSDWAPEIAMNTWHLRHNHHLAVGFDWTTEMGALPGQLKGKFDDHWSDLSPFLSSRAAITQIKTSHIDALGHTVHQGVIDITDNSLQGEGGANMLPPEVALCVSEYGYGLGTFTSHKGRKRGRFYLPYLPVSMLSGDGMVITSALEGVGAAWQGFINDVQGMHTSESELTDYDYWDWVVASKIDASWENVDIIAVDSHFDSQRRRQHQAPATRLNWDISHS